MSGVQVGNSAFRDLWIHGLTLFINSVTVAVGLIQVPSPARPRPPARPRARALATACASSSIAIRTLLSTRRHRFD